MVSLEIVRIGLLAPNLLDEIRKHLVRSQMVQVEESGAIINPESSFDTLRRQYRVDKLIEMLDDGNAKSGKKIIGLTEVDIFLPLFTHLFGYAPLNGDRAVVSLSRLKAEDAISTEEKRELFSSRGAKEILHELGHLLGLKHCAVSWCVMRPSMEPEEIDTRDLSYCEICRSLIKEKEK